MEPPAGVAETLHEQPFDKAVDVLVHPLHKGRARAALFENVGECCIDPVRLARVEHARVLEGSSPRNASGYIVFEEATIEAERRAPLERRVIGRRVKTARP